MSSIEGTVLDAITGQPISGFSVRGSRPALADARASAISRTVEQREANAILQPTVPSLPVPGTAPSRESIYSEMTTNATGRFLLEGLAAGPTTVTFSKIGYLPQTIPYTLRSGQRTAGLLIQATPVGIVSGRVVDAAGRPAVNCRVTAFAFINTGGYPQQVNRGEETTNDRGEYRFWLLEPDRYFIGFQPPSVPSARPAFSVAEGALLYPGVDSLSKTEFIEVKAGNETRLKDVTFFRDAHFGEVRIHIRNDAGEPVKDLSFWFMNTTSTESIRGGTKVRGTQLRPLLTNRCTP